MVWGRKPPEGTVVAWDARGIWEGSTFVDLLWDRQGIHCPDNRQADLNRLVDWLNDRGLKEIKRQAAESLTPSSVAVVSFDEGDLHIEASPQRSYGYLYLGAWIKEPTP